MMAVGERAKLYGINLTGLNGAGLLKTPSGVKTAYKIIFRSGLTLTRAFDKIAEEGLSCAEVQHLGYFTKNSERGIIR